MTKQQALKEAQTASSKAQELEDYIDRNNGSTLGLVQHRRAMYTEWAQAFRDDERRAWVAYYAA